jgi:cytochrome c-type protein NapB
MEKEMKISKITLGLFTATTLFMVGCIAQNGTITEESIGLRQTNLYSENSDTVGDKTEYNKEVAGTSKIIERAFENAPPMIPHDVEGMLPITIDNNSCTGCHEPAVAPSMGATAIPKSHFTNFRPDTSLSKNGSILKEGKVIINTSDIKVVKKPLDSLSGSRFNCSACHVPQSSKLLVPVNNEFQAEFRKNGANKKSNLIDNINEGVDTIK